MIMCDTGLPCSQEPFSSFGASQASSPGNQGVLCQGKVVPPARPYLSLTALGHTTHIWLIPIKRDEFSLFGGEMFT